VSDIQIQKRIARQGRRKRVRRKVHGTAAKPRLSVYRSLGHIYAQIIDDDSGKTLASASSLRIELPAVEEPAKEAEGDAKGKKKGEKKAAPSSLKMRRSIAVGAAIAETALSKGIENVIFDRGGFLYHGRVAALAEAARKKGLKF
jgi:large subunit ribosomal protein L18